MLRLYLSTLKPSPNLRGLNPTESQVQERLARRVVSEKADLGFSYDTDGDRMGVVDNDPKLACH